MKKGITYNSRRESEFVKRIPADEREEYIKGFIASCNAEQLIPFIKITNHDKHYRKISYEICIPKGD